MIKEVMDDAHERMEKTIESLRQDLMTIRTGRASPALVEHLTIEYYGMPTPLLQLATISVPEAQQIVIRPYARGDIGAIEKAIAKSDLGLTPNNDGQQIRLMIPALTVCSSSSGQPIVSTQSPISAASESPACMRRNSRGRSRPRPKRVPMPSLAASS